MKCKTCEGNAYYCTSCDESLIHFGHMCVDECLDGYFIHTDDLNKKSCKMCHRNCKTCAERFDKCLTCPSESDVLTEDHKCQPKCDQPGTFLDSNNQCEQCDSNCKACEYLPDHCIECAAPKYFQKHKCVDECSAEYYLETVGPVNNQTVLGCAECVFPCNECTGPYECQACKSPYELDEESGNCLVYEHKANTECDEGHQSISGEICIEGCGDQLQLNNQTNQCECLDSCRYCGFDLYAGEGVCQVCNFINYPSKTLLYRGGCFEHCPNGTFHIETTNQCKEECLPPMLILHTSNHTKCLKTCPEGYVKQRQMCIMQECADGYYMISNGSDFQQRDCKNCHQSCKKCSGNQDYQCSECYNGWNLLITMENAT